jgi:CelD/BcsL family acetyltransferase involved in cellulose biosynthesis
MTLPLVAPISVEELTDRAAIAALAPEWERLQAEVAAAGGTSGPFLSPSWFAVFAASLADDLRILVAHRGGHVIGILPLMMEKRRLAKLPATVLRSLSDDHSQRFDVLLSPSEPQHAAAALWQHLRQMGGWDAIELREIPDGHSGAALLIAEAKAAGHAIGELAAMSSPYLAAGGEQSAKFRSNLRRRKKKLEAEVGPVTLERIDARGAELEAALDEGLALEKAGWKGERGTAIACDPALRRRYLQLAQVFAARGTLALCFLKAGGRRVAFHFAVLENGTYYLFKPGFDPELSSFGLGHLLIEAVLNELPGIRELDFLGDDMPWKREWTDTLRPHSWRYIYARSPWGRALFTWKQQLVPEIKRVLQKG